MSIAAVPEELALSLRLALEAESAALGRDADAGTEEWRAWLLILEKVVQRLTPAQARHYTVFIAEASGIEDLWELREALGLTGRLPPTEGVSYEELPATEDPSDEVGPHFDTETET